MLASSDATCVATDVAGKSLLPVNVQFSFAQEGLLCWHCRLLTFVNNPFSSQNGGPSDPYSTLSAPTVLEYQLQLSFPQFTCVANDVRLIANSTYHGLQLLAEKRYSNRLQFLAIYTWSKSIDDSSPADDNVTWPASFSSLQDPNKPWLERSLSTFDIPHLVLVITPLPKANQGKVSPEGVPLLKRI